MLKKIKSASTKRFNNFIVKSSKIWYKKYRNKQKKGII